jgi:malonyl CoA-acyl carrier protein transacylase
MITFTYCAKVTRHTKENWYVRKSMITVSPAPTSVIGERLSSVKHGRTFADGVNKIRNQHFVITSDSPFPRRLAISYEILHK